MANKDLHAFFAYPARGLGILIIFVFVSPTIQALAFLFFNHQWVGGDNLLIEITDLISKHAFDAIRGGFSVFMPAAFISGVACAFVTGSGKALTMNGAILRSLIAVVACELFIDLIVFLNNIHQPSEVIIRRIISSMIAGVLAGWVSWIVSKRFFLDQPVEEKHNL